MMEKLYKLAFNIWKHLWEWVWKLTYLAERERERARASKRERENFVFVCLLFICETRLHYAIPSGLQLTM